MKQYGTMRGLILGALVVVAAGVGLVLTTAPATGQEDDVPPPVVAVLDIRFDAGLLSSTAQESLNEYMSSQIANAKFYVVPRDQVARALVDQKVKQQADCYGSCRVKLGGAVGATKVVQTKVRRIGKGCTLTSDLYDLGTEAMEKSETEKGLGCTEEGLMIGIEKVAARLGGVMPIIKDPPPPPSGPLKTGGGTVQTGVNFDRGENIVNEISDKTGILWVETDPPKASILINNKLVGTGRYQDSVMVGRYIITATLNSYYHDAAQEVFLTTEGATVNLVLPPAFGTLKVTSQPSDAEVLIDDKPVGRTPYTDTQMKSGEYRVEVRKDLYKSDIQQVVVSDGQSASKSFQLAADFGALNVASTPSGAQISIDGQATGRKTPASFAQVSSGLHVVTLDLDGHGRRVDNVRVTAGGSERLDATLEPKLGMLTVMTEDGEGAPCQGTLTIDGKPVGTTPWKGNLIATAHTVEAKCGDGSKSETVTIEHNASRVLKIRMVASTKGYVKIPAGSFVMGSPASEARQINEEESPVTSPQYYDLKSYEVVLIMSGTATPKALVEDPRGKTYVVKVGDPIGNRDGKIVSISADEVRIDEPGYPPVVKLLNVSEDETPNERSAVDQGPQTRVTISHPFLLKATEVTQGEWKAVMGSNPSYFRNCGDDCPVEDVSWNDAVEYCNKLSKKENLEQCYDKSGDSYMVRGGACRGYRLPTEAEWEYAARAGSTADRYGEINEVAWYGQNSGSKTHPVGQKQANAWGLYDMLGNVREWCSDWYGDYSGASVTDPTGPSSGSYRVVRGGSFDYVAKYVRAAYRYYYAPGYRYNTFGLRPARSLP